MVSLPSSIVVIHIDLFFDAMDLVSNDDMRTNFVLYISSIERDIFLPKTGVKCVWLLGRIYEAPKKCLTS